MMKPVCPAQPPRGLPGCDLLNILPSHARGGHLPASLSGANNPFFVQAVAVRDRAGLFGRPGKMMTDFVPTANASTSARFLSMFKPRDIFLHDGKSLRRFTIGARVQMA